jgi:hypothetical protein
MANLISLSDRAFAVIRVENYNCTRIKPWPRLGEFDPRGTRSARLLALVKSGDRIRRLAHQNSQVSGTRWNAAWPVNF